MHGDGRQTPDSDDSPGTRRTDLLSTYRHLRLAMVLLLAMLLVAVVDEAFFGGARRCFEGSISAYYYTPVQAVFVGVLCALGACLIVYRGKTDHEDVALNLSGALAFVVAFVPTSPPTADGTECRVATAPTLLDEAIDNNMRAYFIVAVAALALAIRLTSGRDLSAVQRSGHAVLGVLLAVGIVSFWLWPEGFRDRAHGIAAILTFVGILLVVLSNALRIKRPSAVKAEELGAEQAQDDEVGTASPLMISHSQAGTIYVLLAVVMVVSLLGFYVLHRQLGDDWGHGILVIEALLLAEFLVFWMTQTSELWDDDAEPPPPKAPQTASAEASA